MLSDPAKKLIRLTAPAAFWLGLWVLAAKLIDQPLFLPGPRLVFSTLMELASGRTFWVHVAVTFLRIVSGAALGILAGAALGVLTHFSRTLDVLLSPAVRVVRAAPVVSFIILVILWAGSDRVPAIICAMMVCPVVWEDLRAGLSSPGRDLLEMARSYGIGPLRRARYIYLPASLPYLKSGILSSLGLAWKSGVAAEVLCTPRRAVGTQVYYSKLYLETPALFAWTLVVVALSLLLEWAVRRALGEKTGGDGREI